MDDPIMIGGKSPEESRLPRRQSPVPPTDLTQRGKEDERMEGAFYQLSDFD